MPLNPKRTVEELKELRTLTGNEQGAQRVAFTDTWLKARAFLQEKLRALPVDVKRDPAGNFVASGCIINGRGSIPPQTLPATGAYVLLLDPGDRATGTTQLQVTTS